MRTTFAAINCLGFQNRLCDVDWTRHLASAQFNCFIKMTPNGGTLPPNSPIHFSLIAALLEKLSRLLFAQR